MLSYCLRCRKNTESKNPSVAKPYKRKTMLLWKCAVYDSKKSTFIKEQEASGILGKIISSNSSFSAN